MTYFWFGFNKTTGTFTGGNETSHWNDQPSTSFRDKPLSYYSSMDNETLRWQLSEMHRAGLDFIVASWWGKDDYTNDAVTNLFHYVQATNDSMKIAIMVEPYNGLNVSDAEYYVESHFYSVYQDHIFNWLGKPLLCWFLPTHPLDDLRFTIRVVGNRGGEDWKYVSGTNSTYEGSNKADVAELNDYANGPYVAADDEVTVIPSFDNWYEYSIGGRADYIRFNVNHSTDLLHQEMRFAYTANATLIIVTSWNEYTEGSMIEPHYSPSGQFVDLITVIHT
jgi:hypothetical protein